MHEGFDLAIRLGHLKDSTLVARKLAQRVPYACASPAYTARHGIPNSLSELARHTCLVATATSGTSPWTVDPTACGCAACSTANSGHALLDAALKGIGIIQLPDYDVSDHLVRGDLIELLPELRAPEEGIWALIPTIATSPPRCGCWWTTSPNGSAIPPSRRWCAP